MLEFVNDLQIQSLLNFETLVVELILRRQSGKIASNTCKGLRHRSRAFGQKAPASLSGDLPSRDASDDALDAIRSLRSNEKTLLDMLIQSHDHARIRKSSCNG
jgi:hypothetical protein